MKPSNFQKKKPFLFRWARQKTAVFFEEKGRRLLFSFASGLLLFSLTEPGVQAQVAVQPYRTSVFLEDLEKRADYHATQSSQGTLYDDDSQRGGEMIFSEPGQRKLPGYGGVEGFSGNQDWRDPVEHGVSSGYNAFWRPDFSASTRQSSGVGYSQPSSFRSTFSPSKYGARENSSARRTFLRAGPLNLYLSAFATAEYNDNITRVKNGKISDIYLSAGLGLAGNVDFSRSVRLGIQSGVSFQRYLDHQDLLDDSSVYLNLLPNSVFTFDFSIGNVFFSIYDQISSTQNLALDYFSLDREDLFNSIRNTLGIAARWRVNSALSVGASYGYSVTFSVEDSEEFDYLDQASHQIAANIGYSPEETWVLGLEGSASIFDYDGAEKNDGISYSLGAFFRTPISRTTSVSLGAGWQIMDFDEGGRIADNDDLGDYYVYLSIQNQLNSEISHSLSLSREAALSNLSNYETISAIRYSLYYRTRFGLSLSPNVFYEKSDESDSANSENYDRYGGGISASYPLAKKLALVGQYQFSNLDSSRQSRDYKEHRVDLGLVYQLARNFQIRGGYQYWTVDLDNGDNGDFSQNRLYLDANYGF